MADPFVCHPRRPGEMRARFPRCVGPHLSKDHERAATKGCVIERSSRPPGRWWTNAKALAAKRAELARRMAA